MAKYLDKEGIEKLTTLIKDKADSTYSKTDTKVAYTVASASVAHPILFANNSTKTGTPSTGAVYYESNATDGTGLTYNPGDNKMCFPVGSTITTGTSNTSGDGLIAKLKTIYAPTTSGGTTYGTGSANQILRSNGSSLYWSASDVSTTSADTAATAGWYRIAQTISGIGNNSGTFYIVAQNSELHTACTIVAGTSYGISASTTLSQLSCSYYTGDCGITKARIVYHTSYVGNYAYLEVYVPTAKKRNISVKFLGHGWQLVSPSTAGSVPSGYTYRSISLSNGGPIASGLTMYSGHLATSADKLPENYPYGLTMYPVYDNGFPEMYGNAFNIYGGGCNQMFLTWNGSQVDGTAEDVPSNLYLRSNRDNQKKWTTWTRVLTDKHYLDMENWTSQTTVSISNMVPNKLYRYSAACTSVTISSFKAGIPNAYNEYMLEFYTGANCVISVPASVKWAFSTPKLRTNKWYQVSIVNNLGVWAEFG